MKYVSNNSLTALVEAIKNYISAHFVSRSQQSLSEAEKTQIRTNIGAGTSSFDGNYNSLSNKPDLKKVATSGSYNDLSNKPTIPTVPTKLSAFTNDSGYQNASQVSSAITEAMAGITGIDYQIVSSLPATGVKGTIYLLSHGGKAPNIYDEYIYVSNSFEKIGTTDVDLSGYVKSADMTEITDTEIDALFT